MIRTLYEAPDGLSVTSMGEPVSGTGGSGVGGPPANRYTTARYRPTARGCCAGPAGNRTVADPFGLRRKVTPTGGGGGSGTTTLEAGRDGSLHAADPGPDGAPQAGRIPPGTATAPGARSGSGG